MSQLPSPLPMLTVQGAGNLRDLGGLRNADGRRLRARALIRSDQLCGLSDEGWRTLAGIPLATLCDLRSAGERQRAPSAIPPEFPARLVEYDAPGDVQGDSTLTAMLISSPTSSGAASVMREIYRQFPRHLAPFLRGAVVRLAAGGAPMLIHCAAGKDRTGFVVAVLLRALGFGEETVLTDYLRSRNWHGLDWHRAALAERLSRGLTAGAIDAVLDPVMDVREQYLAAAFAAIDMQSGSLERYLEREIGLGPRECEQLGRALLE